VTSPLYFGFVDLCRISAEGLSNGVAFHKYSQRQTESAPTDTSDRMIETILPACVSLSGMSMVRGRRVVMMLMAVGSSSFQ